MAIASTIRITNTTTISFPDPTHPHDAVFSGPQRIHKHGHIWLKQETSPLAIPFQIDGNNMNYTFACNTPGDGRAALFIGNSQTSVTGFNGFGGVFEAPTLSPDNRTLTFKVLAFDSNKYFYILNLVGPGGAFPLNDPIIVNK